MTPESPAGPFEVRCQWCGEVGQPGATDCADCGAALPLLDAVGQMIVPGVTHVDPELEAYSKQPMRPPRRSATEALAPGVMQAAVLGGPAAIAAAGALAAIAASELRQTGQGGRSTPDGLGEVSRPVLETARRLQQERARGGGSAEASPSDELALPAGDEDRDG
jgi:hypothetical protein